MADVVLQRPFKHGIRQLFTAWAANLLKEQIDSNELVGLSPFLKMGLIKPLCLEWVLASCAKLSQGREYIKMGWHTCCVSLFDVHDQMKRVQAMEEVLRNELDVGVPKESEDNADAASSSSEEEDEATDVLDVMKKRQFGLRKSTRKRGVAKAFGFQLDSSQIALSEDSES